MQQPQPFCIYCERTSGEVPLIPFIYQDTQAWICPQHLPVLIHQPARLADKLPGIEKLNPAPDHDDE
jgi:hypothetical protein